MKPLEITLDDDGSLDVVFSVYDPDTDITWSSRYQPEAAYNPLDPSDEHSELDGTVDWEYIQEAEEEDREDRNTAHQYWKEQR